MIGNSQDLIVLHLRLFLAQIRAVIQTHVHQMLLTQDSHRGHQPIWLVPARQVQVVAQVARQVQVVVQVARQAQVVVQVARQVQVVAHLAQAVARQVLLHHVKVKCVYMVTLQIMLTVRGN